MREIAFTKILIMADKADLSFDTIYYAYDKRMCQKIREKDEKNKCGIFLLTFSVG